MAWRPLPGAKGKPRGEDSKFQQLSDQRNREALLPTIRYPLIGSDLNAFSVGDEAIYQPANTAFSLLPVKGPPNDMTICTMYMSVSTGVAGAVFHVGLYTFDLKTRMLRLIPGSHAHADASSALKVSTSTDFTLRADPNGIYFFGVKKTGGLAKAHGFETTTCILARTMVVGATDHIPSVIPLDAAPKEAASIAFPRLAYLAREYSTVL